MTDWISDAEAACETATEGPWIVDEADLRNLDSWPRLYIDVACVVLPVQDSQFIALARTALPRALKELREERAKNEKTETALRAADELVEIATQCIDRFSYYEKDMQDRLLIENLISKRKAYQKARK